MKLETTLTGFRLFIEACRARNSEPDRDDKAVDGAWNKLSVGERRHYQERARLICKPPSIANADSDIDDSVSERCSSRATNDDSEIGTGKSRIFVPQWTISRTNC